MLNELIFTQPTFYSTRGKAINMQMERQEAGRSRKTWVIETIIKNKPDAGFGCRTENFKHTSEDDISF